LSVAPSIDRAAVVEPAAPAREAELIHALFERYATQIYGFCLHRLGSREEAEDAVQTTFLNAFRGLARGVEPQAESAWLFKIAENVCLSRHRSAFRRRRVESPTDLEALQDVLPGHEPQKDELVGLERVLEQMPGNQRRAILLREWQGLSYREIAEEMELTQAAVETLIFRARRSLAQGLEAFEADEREPLRRRVSRGADAGGAIAALKTFLGSAAAVKTAAAVVAVTSITVAAAVPTAAHHPARIRHTRSVAPRLLAVARPAKSSTARLAAAPVPAPARVRRAPARQTRVVAVRPRSTHAAPRPPAPHLAAPPPRVAPQRAANASPPLAAQQDSGGRSRSLDKADGGAKKDPAPQSSGRPDRGPKPEKDLQHASHGPASVSQLQQSSAATEPPAEPGRGHGETGAAPAAAAQPLNGEGGSGKPKGK